MTSDPLPQPTTPAPADLGTTIGPAAAKIVQRSDRIKALGAAAWADMERLGISPTPRAYELWFAVREGGITALTDEVSALLHQGKVLTPTLIDSLHQQHVAGPEPDLERLSSGADEMQGLAQALVEQVSGGRTAMAGYGDVLSHWAEHLGRETTMAGVVSAVGTLTAETLRAVERSRSLEQQLSASTARIAKLRRSLADVKQEATIDALTGIANRKAFDARLRRAIAASKADPDVRTSVLMLDVDNFKRFNDTYGHRTGDLVLRLVGRLLADNVKGRDTVARYGGEEFAIMLIGADCDAATAVARQICVGLASKRLINKPSHQFVGQITISVGVAQHRSGETMGSLIERADAALYLAKDTGRNRVCSEVQLAHSGRGVSDPARQMAHHVLAP